MIPSARPPLVPPTHPAATAAGPLSAPESKAAPFPPSHAEPPTSLARSGLKAGGAFALALLKGGALALVLGGGALLYHIVQMGRAGGFAGQLGWWPSLVMVLLALCIPAYFFAGMAQGRQRVMRQFVASHGPVLTQRLTTSIAQRIESHPSTPGALQRVPDWLSVDGLSAQVAPWLGQGHAVRSAIGLLLKRLPLLDILTQWQASTQPTQGAGGAIGSALGVTASAAPVSSPFLRDLLAQRLEQTLADLAAPSNHLYYLVMASQCVLLGLGWWALQQR